MSEVIQTVDQLVEHLKIKTWDYLLVGDGSGSNWSLPIGWASTLISNTGFHKVFYGGCNYGTNNLAELMAYVLPLFWLTEEAHRVKAPISHVHIVSDSAYVCNGINARTRQKANKELWQAIQATRASGLSLTAHWIPRDSVNLNQLADCVSKTSRKVIKELTIAAATESVKPDSLAADLLPFAI